MATPVIWVLLSMADSALADFEGRGEVGLETRVFKEDHLPITKDRAAAIFTRIDHKLTLESLPSWEMAVRGFARVDQQDRNRDIIAPEDLYLAYEHSELNFQVRAGFQMFNWTATEAFHPADVVNSRNLDSNVESPEKLGELGISATKSFETASIHAFFFPRYEEPILPNEHSRLGTGANISRARFVEWDGHQSKDNWGFQGGLKFDLTWGEWDLSLQALHLMDRQHPLFMLDETARISPYYFKNYHYGLTSSFIVAEGLIHKLEFAYKDFPEKSVTGLTVSSPLLASGIEVVGKGKDHAQLANGLEKGFLIFNAYDLTAILEHQVYLGTNKTTRTGLGLFQNDMVVGSRFAFNDTMSKELLILGILDLERSGEWTANLQYSQRLNDFWSFKGGLRYVEAKKGGLIPRGLESLRDADHLYATLTRFF